MIETNVDVNVAMAAASEDKKLIIWLTIHNCSYYRKKKAEL